MTTHTPRLPARYSRKVFIPARGLVAEGMKSCPAHGMYLPLSEFYRYRSPLYAGGYRYSAYCKQHEYERKRGKPRNPEPQRAATKRYRERNKEKVAAQDRERAIEYYADTRAERADYQEAYRAANKERERERKRRWYEAKKAKREGEG